MITHLLARIIPAFFIGAAGIALAQSSDIKDVPDPATMPDIHAYCLDINWAHNKKSLPKDSNRFAKPGDWSDLDPKEVVEWHKTIGCNVIQTFCVSHNGYAWYRNEVTPEQPGLKHDFLRETVKLGHTEGMVVMGYFSIAANTRWGEANPELSYGTPSTYHLPYTDEYLAYLDAAIRDAVTSTGIDGFMIDWIWQPKRLSTKGKWIEAEKKLYEQLMGEPFPGEDKLTEQQDLQYSRKAIDRCWKTIRKAAKESNPQCIVWLTCNSVKDPHVVNSDLFREIDWLMAETGSNKKLQEIQSTVGKHTRLLTCLAAWNNANPAEVIPGAKQKGIGLYGFCQPMRNRSTIPLDGLFDKPITMMGGDQRNIAALARTYHGKSLQSVCVDGSFVEPSPPPALRPHLLAGGRGTHNLAKHFFEKDKSEVHVITPHMRGGLELTRVLEKWPARIIIKLESPSGHKPVRGITTARANNGTEGCEIKFGEETATVIHGTVASLGVERRWAIASFKAGEKTESIPLKWGGKTLEFVLPSQMTDRDPEVIQVEWGDTLRP